MFKITFTIHFKMKIITANVQKFLTHFSIYSHEDVDLQSCKHKMCVIIANREDPDQTASSEAV